MRHCLDMARMAMTPKLIALVAVILAAALAIIIPAANAQVSIQQSQNSDVNGVKTSSTIKSDNGKTEIRTDHGKLILQQGDHIRYCNDSGQCGPIYDLSNTTIVLHH